METITMLGIIKLVIKFGIALGTVTIVGKSINAFNKSNFKTKKGGRLDDSDIESKVIHH